MYKVVNPETTTQYVVPDSMKAFHKFLVYLVSNPPYILTWIAHSHAFASILLVKLWSWKQVSHKVLDIAVCSSGIICNWKWFDNFITSSGRPLQIPI